MFTKKPDRDTQQKSSPQTSASKSPLVLDTPVASPASKAPAYTSKAPAYKGSEKMVPSIIGEDLTVTGNVISKGEVQVDGEIQGDVHCASLIIGDKAQITGGVVADDVVVRGRIVGSIRGQRVTLQSSSHVEGDIYHQSLAIEQGAFFEGKSRRSDDPTNATHKTTPDKPSASTPPSTPDKPGSSGEKAPRAAE